jgi:NADP-dependent 3-hydroxy acid dehydrogenase YdfG
VAVVTGASSGIGRAIALGLAERGANVCLTGRDADRLCAAANLARASGAKAQTFLLDLTVDEDVVQLATTLRAAFGRVDVLVHSAGSYARGRLEQAPVAELDAQYGANLRAPYVLTQALLPMLSACAGRVVFINSTAGLSARGEASQFAATQHALRALADSFREEVNAVGIRVLNVFLGRTATPRQANIYRSEGRTYQPDLLVQPEDVAAMVISALTLSPSAEVTDMTIRPAVKSY